MKEIKAIVRKFKLDEFVTALHSIEGVPGFTVSDVNVYPRGDADVDHFKPAERLKIELVVADDMLESIVSVIRDKAFTGNPGDGKIFIYDVHDVRRIRTGDRGESAL